jgi:hypothetical protein
MSFFNLRFQYNNIFTEENFRSMEDIFADPEKTFDFDSTKIKKIRYSINLMLQTGMYIQESKCGPIEIINPEVSLM